MGRLESIHLDVTTGARGHDGPVTVEFNSFRFECLDSAGRAAPGQRLDATLPLRSFAHALRLLGPAQGAWEIARLAVTYDTGGEPYTVTFEPFVLEAGEVADLMAERPTPYFDV